MTTTRVIPMMTLMAWCTSTAFLMMMISLPVEVVQAWITPVTPSRSSTDHTSLCLHAIKLPFLTTTTTPVTPVTKRNHNSNNSKNSQKPMIPTKSKLTPIQRLKVQQYNNNNKNNNNGVTDGWDTTTTNPWDQFKRVMYTVRDATTRKVTHTNPTNQIFAAPSFTIPSTRVTMTMMNTARPFFPSLVTTRPIVQVQVPPPPPPSWFDTIKGTIYETADRITTTTTTAKVTTQRSPSKMVKSSTTKPVTTVPDPFTQIKQGFYAVSDFVTKRPAPATRKRTTTTFVTTTIPKATTPTVTDSLAQVPATMTRMVEQTQLMVQSIAALPEHIQDRIAATQSFLDQVTQIIPVPLGLRPPVVVPPPPSDRFLTMAAAGATALGKSLVGWGQTTLGDWAAARPNQYASPSEIPAAAGQTTTSNHQTENDDDLLDIMATLQLANEAIALAEQETTTKTKDRERTLYLATSTVRTTTPNEPTEPEDDVLDIMATLQLANEAIALAEQVTTTTMDRERTLLSATATDSTTTPNEPTEPEDDLLDITATLQLANEAIALAEQVTSSNAEMMARATNHQLE